MSGSSVELKRRHLLVVGGTAAAVACSANPTAMLPTSDVAARPDVSTPPPEMDEPFLGLDGGIASPESMGWRSPGGGVDVGSVGEFAMNTWKLNAGARAIVARDAAGFFAYSALCTHERCLVGEPDAMGVTTCNCHGSRFDGAGRVMQGPAAVPLRHLAVAILGGRVYVDPSMRVADNARTPVPEPTPDGGTADASADVPSDGSVDAPDAAPDVPRDTGPDVNPCTTGTDVGPVTMFAAGSWTRLRPQALIVGRDAMGLFAFSALCTHQSCVVDEPDAEGAMLCGCHGSRFDGNGRVTRGPASEDLEHYQVRVCEGRVRVDRGSFVPATSRTPVP